MSLKREKVPHLNSVFPVSRRSKKRNAVFFSFAMVFSLVFICSGCQRQIRFDGLENISVTVSFMHVERESDRKAIDDVIRNNALFPDKIVKKGKGGKFDYAFTVRTLDDLNAIHREIVYNSLGHHMFNAVEPEFSVNYMTADIHASIDIILTFRVTPRATLVYKTYRGEEVDISHMIDSKGVVKLNTQISRGQEYIKAKIISGKIERFIKIDIVTQKVEEIGKDEYLY